MSKSPYRNPGEREVYDIKIDKKIDWSEMSWNVFCFTFWGSLGLSLAGAICFLPFKALTADGKADYCIIDTDQVTGSNGYSIQGQYLYDVDQHIPWRPNRHLARGFKTSEEAHEEAKKFECPIK